VNQRNEPNRLKQLKLLKEPEPKQLKQRTDRTNEATNRVNQLNELNELNEPIPTDTNPLNLPKHFAAKSQRALQPLPADDFTTHADTYFAYAPAGDMGATEIRKLECNFLEEFRYARSSQSHPANADSRS
jgi:hypothetical protein